MGCQSRPAVRYQGLSVKDVVIIPVFHRIDYIEQCFNSLLNARGIDGKRVWVFQDNRRGAPDIKPVQKLVLDLVPKFPNSRFWLLDPHDEVGFLNNTHYALSRAWDSGAEKIYYIEDDVVVTRDFFEWHDAVQADGDWMCSSAWRPPAGAMTPQHAEEYYFKVQFPTTISIGTCFKRDKLKIALQTHDWNPQDRMLAENWQCVMPYVQRCFHVGSKSCHPGSNGCLPEAVDVVSDPIPDYRTQKVVLR